MSAGKMLRNMIVGGEAGLLMDARELARDNQALAEHHTVVVKTANHRLEKMAADIKDLNADRMEMAAVGGSALKIIDLMVRKIAQLTGESPENISRTFNKERSRAYDEILNSMLADKRLVIDPRKGGVTKERKWYAPDASTP